MTNDEYHRNLQRLAALDPACLLLNKLRQGPSLVNELLLLRALSEIEINPPTEQVQLEMEEEDDPVDDVTLKTMRTKLRKLFSERNRLSDHLHICKNNTERAHTSEDIQITQRNIERTMQRIRQYKQDGTLADDETAKDYLPKDGLALSKKLNSLRANVSRQKKIVAELDAINSTDPAHLRKLEKAKDRLQELKRLKKNAEEAVENLH